MNIKEYQSNINAYPYGEKLNSGINNALTIDDFYNNCIKNILLEKKKVLAWHKMLMEYAKLPEAIYWVRYFENYNKAYREKFGVYNTRRGCLTIFKDGFKYVFVSNYDVHQLFNMIYNNVTVPTPEEFLNLMKSFAYKFSYCIGSSCDESKIYSYPNLANVNKGYKTALGKKSWYLAHIDGIKRPYLLQRGKIDFDKEKQLKEHIFPRGQISDWRYEKSTNNHIRQLDYSLTPEEKSIVKAHFLRFVDPLNYFLVPNTTHHINGVRVYRNNIGEDLTLGTYMREIYKNIFGQDNVDDFLKEALICPNSEVAAGGTIIDITYGLDVKRRKNNSPSKIVNKYNKSSLKPKQGSNTRRVKKYSPAHEQLLLNVQNKFPYQFDTKINKAADLFIRVIMYLNEHNLLEKDDITMLISSESKKVFKTGYITLTDSNHFIKNKYYKTTTININGVDYYPTYDFGKGDVNVDCIVKWAASKGLIV